MKAEQLGALSELVEAVALPDGHIYKMPLLQGPGRSAYRDPALAADQVKKYLRLRRLPGDGAVLRTRNDRLAKAGPHLFIEDHVHRTVVPAGNAAIDIPVRA